MLTVRALIGRSSYYCFYKDMRVFFCCEKYFFSYRIAIEIGSNGNGPLPHLTTMNYIFLTSSNYINAYHVELVLESIMLE